MARYLTKSLFKKALECETKLYYSKKKEIYPDQSLEDDFLKALAEGGFQVGKLAQYYFCDDPVEQNIPIESLDYAESVSETQRRIDNGVRLIAEAAFRYENLFIRTDIIEVFADDKLIRFYEVKAKSWDSTTTFTKYDNKTSQITGINSKWKEHLYDVAFQKFVLSQIYPDYRISAFLYVVNKEAIATVDGINQLFKIYNDDGLTRVKTEPGLQRNQLGEELLKKVNVDDEVNWIWQNPIETLMNPGISFEDYVTNLSKNYVQDEKIETPLGKKCSDCEFRLTDKDANDNLRSGFEECWLFQTGLSKPALKCPLVTELWSGRCGSRSLKQELIDMQVYLIKDVEESMIAPKSGKAYAGLSPTDRRMIQVEKVKNDDPSPYIDTDGLIAEFRSWKYPLHFIDFETSRVAIPFHSGRKPYEQIAFQFSHHKVGEDGAIKHAGQFISFEPGHFPNYDFIRKLKEELETDEGTIFRYHNHENSVLLDIYRQLTSDANIPDSQELMHFIRSITHNEKDNKWKGERDMTDMFDLVLKYYYPPGAGGSNSLKYILPATINISPFLQEKYSRPVCGRNAEVSSLNFDIKTWLEPDHPFDPYKSLPVIFEDHTTEQLDQLIAEFDEIRDGGAAMTAYAKLQFSEIPDEQRDMIKNSLLKYCELDTLAMVMIWEYWNNEIAN